MPDYLQTGSMAFFLSLYLNWNIGSSWILSLLTFGLELPHWLFWFSGLWTQAGAYTSGSLESPACWLNLQTLGLVSPHNCVNQSLIISFFLNICILSVLFLWRTLTNTVTKWIPRINIISIGHKGKTSSRISLKIRCLADHQWSMTWTMWMGFSVFKSAFHYPSSTWESTICSPKHSRVPS